MILILQMKKTEKQSLYVRDSIYTQLYDFKAYVLYHYAKDFYKYNGFSLFKCSFLSLQLEKCLEKQKLL